MRRGAGRNFAVVAVVAAAVGLSGCGSGARQDKNEPSGNFPVQVTAATFPSHQVLAQRSRLVIQIRNTGSKTIPDLAVTICNVTCRYPAPVGEGTSVQPFAHWLNMPGLAYHSRPTWIIDTPPGHCGYSCANGGPGSYFTVDANTWATASGDQGPNHPLTPGATATFAWAVTAVASGHYTVAWQIAAGINGKARAVQSDGSIPHGTFTVNIARAPAQSYVNDSGAIVHSK
jgi:hypothetical protein